MTVPSKEQTMQDNGGATYSPFDEAFDKLESAHLEVLRNVHEVW